MEEKVLALVNGRQITEGDLKVTLERFPEERQSFFYSEEGKKQLLDQIISFELVYDYAKETDIEKDAIYLAQLEKVKKDIMIQAAIDREFSGINVNDEEVELYYKSNIESFKTQEAVSAKHILVDTLEKSLEIKNKIEDGMSFEEAASLYSSCPSKSQGGNLGTFERGRMVPEFEEAAFNLKLGIVSLPVKTQFGYHLIKVEDKKAPEYIPLEQVKQNVINHLIQEKRNLTYMQLINKLKDKYTIEVK